jgi:hypothetical protein
LEKPDYRFSPKLGLVFIYIYSLVKFKEINKVDSNGYVTGEQIDETSDIIAEIIKSDPVLKSSLSAFMLNYNIDDQGNGRGKNGRTLTTDGTFIRLRRHTDIQEAPSNINIDVLAIPKNLN